MSGSDLGPAPPLRLVGAQRFHVVPEAALPRTRPLGTPAGVADRVRAVAFAELEARDAFAWAAERFAGEVHAEVARAWLALARAEDRHHGWLVARLAALGERLDGRPVGDRLLVSFAASTSAADFAVRMALAEDAGRRAGERFAARLAVRDPASAALFGRLAEEERAHVALAARYFPDALARARPALLRAEETG